MELHQYYKEFVLVILCVYLHYTSAFDYDDDIETTVWTRCSSSIRNKLKNGRVKIRSRGRIAKFMCDPGFEIVGKRFATCVRNHWNNPLPVCVARGCFKMQEPVNGRMTEMYRGALLTFDCLPGYVLDGANTLYCDGRRWSVKAPLCKVATNDPKLSCDFEDPDLCGWTHDPTHDFDWKRHQFSTPSGHVGTGPSYDHTFGKGKGGFYLYEEASSPRKENDKSRIFSPVYPPQYSGGCFIFWYHMYGATTGGLLVYVKPESHVFDELTPTWQKVGDQGNQWIRGNITLPILGENFQIVIEGVRGSSYVGDSAIDDVSLNPTADCESMHLFNVTDVLEEPVTDSCRGRCKEEEDPGFCGCNENCYLNETCCLDYVKICTAGNTTDDILHPEETVTADEFEMKFGTNGLTKEVTDASTTITTQWTIVPTSKHTADIISKSNTPLGHLPSSSSYTGTFSPTDTRTTASVISTFHDSQSERTSTDNFLSTLHHEILPETSLKPKQVATERTAQPTTSSTKPTTTTGLVSTTEAQTKPTTIKTTMEITTKQPKSKSTTVPIITTPTERSTLPASTKTVGVTFTTKMLTRPTVRQTNASTAVATAASAAKTVVATTPKTVVSTTPKTVVSTTPKTVVSTTPNTVVSTTPKNTAAKTQRSTESTTLDAASTNTKSAIYTTLKTTAFTTPRVTTSTAAKTEAPTKVRTTFTAPTTIKSTPLKPSTLTTTKIPRTTTKTITSVATQRTTLPINSTEAVTSSTNKVTTVSSTSRPTPSTAKETTTVRTGFTIKSSTLPSVTESIAPSTSKWTTRSLPSTRPSPVPVSTSTRRYNLRPRTSTLWIRSTSYISRYTFSTRRGRYSSTSPVYSTTTVRSTVDSTSRRTSTKMVPKFPLTSSTPIENTESTISMNMAEVESQGHSRSHSDNEMTMSTIIGVSVSVVLVSCLAGGILYVLAKRRIKQQSKMTDDSEMRFLSDNEVIEYSDASALDRILVH